MNGAISKERQKSIVRRDGVCTDNGIYYRDPTSEAQEFNGPFNESTVQQWYREGFFHSGIQFRLGNSPGYTTLDRLRELNGKSCPFAPTKDPRDEEIRYLEDQLKEVKWRLDGMGVENSKMKERIEWLESNCNGMHDEIVRNRVNAEGMKEMIENIEVRRVEDIRSEMDGCLVRMFDDGTEKRKEMSFMDLSDNIHINIMNKLDLRSRLRMRLNKRLDALQLSVENELQYIDLEIDEYGNDLTVGTFNGSYSRKSIDHDQLEQGLRRLALNTSVNRYIYTDVFLDSRDKDYASIIDAIFKFKAGKLRLYVTNTEHEYENYRIKCGWFTQLLKLPQVNLSNMLTLVENVKDVDINIHCSSLSAQDLCILRKTFLEGNCVKFRVRIDESIIKAFIETCFGVTIEEVDEPVRGRIYRAADESVQLYIESWPDSVECPPYYRALFYYVKHFEDAFETVFELNNISFNKDDIDEELDEDWIKIEYNHLYAYY